MSQRVKIVSSLTRTGSSIGQSDSIVNAIRMRLEDADYTVAGCPIEYFDWDGGSEARGSWDAEQEQANARRAAADSEVLAYIGTLDADAAPHSIPILNAAGPLLMISPCNTYPGLTRPFDAGEPDCHYPTGRRNYVRTALPDDLQGAFAADWAAEMGATRVFVTHDGEPYGRGVAVPFADACRARGLDVVGEPLEIVRKCDSYEDVSEQVRDQDADLFFYGGIIQNGAGALWRDVRTNNPDATMMGADALFEHAFIRDAGEHADGTLITFGGIPPGHLEGPGKAFFERYVRTFGKPPECYGASAYDAVGAVLDAIERAGTGDRAAVTEAALATKDFDGLVGRWSFDENGDIDLRRGTRLVVRGDDFFRLETRDIDLT